MHAHCQAGSIHLTTEILKSREQMFNDRNIIIEWMQYKKQYFDAYRNPKQTIREYCDKNGIPLPTYETNMSSTKHQRHQFYSIITYEGKKFTSVFWNRNKTTAEQSAALVCAFHLGLYEEYFLQSIGCLINRC